ncbi:MAG: hypothetical protein IPK85_01840 [Gemmatimonadetes bacterium]|nr:hypothetical protein [Gemmatimonadota bacterium]
MNKHIAKLRDQLLAEERRLSAELAEVHAGLKAIGIVHEASDERKPAVRPGISAALKEKFANDPDYRSRYLARAAKMRATREAKRLNGAAVPAEASA